MHKSVRKTCNDFWGDDLFELTSVLQSSKLVEILIGSSTSQKVPFKIKSALTTTPNAAVRPIDTAGNSSYDGDIEHCYAA